MSGEQGDMFGAGAPEPADGLPERGTCRLCGAAIVWIRTNRGRALRVSPMPCDDKVRTVVTDGGEVVRGRESHFATCPRGGEVRQPRPTGKAVRRHG